ncbi:MAG: hypothetical protein E4H15_03825 [Syntrophobacterales bacterium]|nr:MAG: hypothetical protein E4H15_03825 [Syntrophobacterales bacterium]
MDEAFLRRIPYKIKIDHPSEREYEAIFKMYCRDNGVDFNQDTFDYLLDSYYRKNNVKLNACHPRDIIEQIIVNARYNRLPPRMSQDAIHEAWTNYFVEM